MDSTLLGTFASWEIISPNMAIKHCDKSVFNRLGSSIPKPTRWFWGIENSPINTRKKIYYRYLNKKYQGKVNIYSNDLSQIYWDNILMEAIDLIINPNSYPDMVFERIGKDYYEVSFLNSGSETNDFESVILDKNNIEGKAVQYYTTKYERKASNRIAAIRIHGTKCMACGFDFEETYGIIGKNFIEVHHIKPLYSLEEETAINPETDLICLCSNCHRIIHRKRDGIISLEELREIIRNKHIKQ